MRMAGRALQYLRSLGETALIADIARARQIHRGQRLYDNVPQLYADAVKSLVDEGLPVTPKAIREAADAQLWMQEAQIDDSVGILIDRYGRRIEDPEAELVSVNSAPYARTDPADDPYRDTPF